VLGGENPADLPIEGIDRFVFMINLKTARQIGVTVPEVVLFRADKVIE
jgi:putative ABC transport system substrate-binding protein